MNRLVAGIVVVVVVAAIAIGAALFFLQREDADDSTAGSIQASATVTPVVRADAVVVPIRSADLGMPRQGVVSHILVDENDTVEEGQVLVRLDDADAVIAVQRAEAAIAAAQADIETLKVAIAKERELDDESRAGRLEDARVAAQQARELFLHLSGANRAPNASVSADGAVLEAKLTEALANAQSRVEQAEEALLIAMGVASTDDIAQTSASLASKVERDARIANARLAIFDLQQKLEDAQDFSEIRSDAQTAVTTANALLNSSKVQLDVQRLKNEEDGRIIQDAYDDAVTHWRRVHEQYLGITLTDDELLTDPDTLFQRWGVDLETLFDPTNLPFSNGVFEDNPGTRWNELTLFAWLRLHPGPTSILVTCDNVDLPRAVVCIERDYDNAWDTLSAVREDLLSHELKASDAMAAAENAVVAAQDKLEDAERALELLQAGRPEHEVVRLQSDLDAANAALEEMLDFPDATEVAQAEANLASAKAALADILPDDLEIALAEQQLEDAELQVAKLERGRDPLDEERREARLAAAESRIAIAEVNLEAARITLQDTELRAPFAGTVVALNVDSGEEVNARQVVMSLADISEWELRTDDLDELSVVNLAEGDSVQVRFDALPELEMSGVVTKISRFGEEKQGAVTYTAEVRLSRTDDRLRWGMTASISR